MKFSNHPNQSILKTSFGDENAPLLVVDNFIDHAEMLIDDAANRNFCRNSAYYPGIRAEVPEAYKPFIINSLGKVLIEVFNISAAKLKFTLGQYSIVTTPPDQLHILQRIPHFDSTDRDGLAAIHYLFKKDLGGTSFYRHRKTGYESIDESRRMSYLRSLEGENGTSNMPAHGYIYGDTPLYTQIGHQEGVFNRLVVYRRNYLHSGSIAPSFVPDSSPRDGRLTITCFIDPA